MIPGGGRVVGAALRLFLERGYAGTTVEAIAAEAHVAPATVYQAFGTKQAILARVLDQAIAGDAEPAGLLDRDWVKQAAGQVAIFQHAHPVVLEYDRVLVRVGANRVIGHGWPPGDEVASPPRLWSFTL